MSCFLVLYIFVHSVEWRVKKLCVREVCLNLRFSPEEVVWPFDERWNVLPRRTGDARKLKRRRDASRIYALAELGGGVALKFKIWNCDQSLYIFFNSSFEENIRNPLLIYLKTSLRCR